MIRFLTLCLVISLTFGCKNKDLSLSQSKVTATLLEFGKQNPESTVLISTSEGNIRLKLYPETPLHRANFIRLVKNHYYSDGIFYRILDGFCIQGGNPPTFPRPAFKVPMEINDAYIHKRGALAMASDKPGIESSATEFYIVTGSKMTQLAVDELKENGIRLSTTQIAAYTSVGGNYSLDKKYTVFGEVTEGIDIVEKIAAVKVYDADKPLQKVTFDLALQR